MTDHGPDPVVIAGAARTPVGAFQGALARESAPTLAGAALAAAGERAGLAGRDPDRLILGNGLNAGQGQAPARQAAHKAGFGDGLDTVLVNKVGGSGMAAAMLGTEALQAGSCDTVLVGGTESMSNAPYLLSRPHKLDRLGHERLADAIFLDGLEDGRMPGWQMGEHAEALAAQAGLTRRDQDAYAMTSLTRARQHVAGHEFDAEIAKVETRDAKGTIRVGKDEGPTQLDPSRITALKPAYRHDGTITAASASAPADGAAALLLTRESVAEAQGLPVLAHVRAQANHGQAPDEIASAPVPAIQKILDKTGWQGDDVDLYEINESFAVVPLVAMARLGLAHERVNAQGGACALGHPLGATGARLLVTLLYGLQRQSLKRGVAAVSVGGGEATAMAIERP